MAFDDSIYTAAFERWKERLTSDNKGIHALARIPDFQALIHTANISSVPIFQVNEKLLREDGIQGRVKEDSLKNVESFDNIYSAVTDKILTFFEP